MHAPVVEQRQVSVKETDQRTVEVPRVQFVDRTVDAPVDLQRNIPTVASTLKTVDVPRVQFIDYRWF